MRINNKKKIKDNCCKYELKKKVVSRKDLKIKYEKLLIERFYNIHHAIVHLLYLYCHDNFLWSNPVQLSAMKTF